MQDNNQQKDPEFSLTAPVVSRIDAVDVLNSIVGQKTISLGGFSSSSAQKGVWSYPAIPFVSVHNEDVAIQRSRSHQNSFRKLILGFCFIAVAFLGVSVGVFWASSKLNFLGQILKTATAWHIAEVNSKGVILESDGKLELIPIGSSLPNGETVLSVIPEKRVFITQSGAVVLHSKK